MDIDLWFMFVTCWLETNEGLLLHNAEKAFTKPNNVPLSEYAMCEIVLNVGYRIVFIYFSFRCRKCN